MSVQLTTEQRDAVYNRGGEILVSAAAGSGKTRVLVERLLSRVESGTDIDRFLVITYTKAAAAELRSRIASELSERLAKYPGSAFLRRQSTLLYKTQISTVHAFCAQFLREEGYRLDVDHDFRLLDESEANILQSDALDRVLDLRYESIERNPDFAFLVDAMSAGRDDSKLAQIALDIRGRIQSHEAPDRWLQEQEKAFLLTGVTDAASTPWGKLLLADARRRADYCAAQIRESLKLALGDIVLEKAYAPSLRETLDGFQALSLASCSGWDEAVTACRKIAFPKFFSSKGCENISAKGRITALRKDCKSRLEKLNTLLADTSAELLEDIHTIYPAIRELFALVRDLEMAYAAEKKRRGGLDFSDLEHMTVRLLTDGEGHPSELAGSWGDRFDEVMVDEYQDTNAVQNAIFTALTGKRANLFQVGDVKQSIYRFRLADPTIFLSKYRSFQPLDEAQLGEPRRVLLSQNFRSRPQVLEGCNYVFRSLMSTAFGEMDYTDAEALSAGGRFSGDTSLYALELDLLDCSQGEASDNDGLEFTDLVDQGPRPPRDLLEARFVAGRIAGLLAEAFPISDGETLRPVRPGDIVILLRSPGAVLHYYASALSERDIPWEAEGTGDFFSTPEIQAAVSLLQVIDNPRQDVALIAALRSPAYSFSADRLAEIRALAPEEDFYTALLQDNGTDTREFLTELQALRSKAGDENCDRLIWELYDRTNLPGIFGAIPHGEAAQSNLLMLARLAQEFEENGHRGLFDFLTWLRRLEETGGKPTLPHTGAVGDGVRILSIHRSKGLEFPVVILAGLARQMNKADLTQPMLFHPKLGVGPERLDTEHMVVWPTLPRLAVARQMEYELSAEELRLLYVAMTRAKDKLILSCALAGGEKDIEKLLPLAASPPEPQALLEQNSPSKWILMCALARPEASRFWSGEFCPPVAPGTEFGSAWDFRFVDAVDLGQTQNTEHTKKTHEEAVTPLSADMDTLFTWVYPYNGDVELPSKLTATQLKGRGLDDEVSEFGALDSSHGQTSGFERPRFAVEKLGLTPAQRGTALHLVMQFIDFDRCDSMGHIQAELARLVEGRFLTPEQGEAVDIRKIFRFISSRLGNEITTSATLRREFKFSVFVPANRYYIQAGEGEKILLQGVVDCFFETLEGITVVDFKTDAVYGDALLQRAEEYRPQLTAYAQALAEMTGKTVCRKVLWFFSEGRAVEL